MIQILPLAITMMAGPQIIASIILLTGSRPIKASLAYVLGVAVASTTGTFIFTVLARNLGLHAPVSGQPSTVARLIQTALIALLMFAVIKTYLGRKTATLPPWVTNLQTASASDAFKFGLKLIFLMPSDLAIMFTVGLSIAGTSSSSIQLVPFIALTTLIASLPLIAYVLLRRRAVEVMPKVTTWMEHNSWVISIAAYLIFIVLLWS